MNRSRQQEEQILIEAIRKDRTGEVSQVVYHVYRRPFADFFAQGVEWEADRHIAHFQEALNILREEIEENGAALLPAPTLFQSLLLVGYTLCQDAWERGRADFLRRLKDAGAYYESDILLLLLKQGHSLVAGMVYERFRKPAFHTFCTRVKGLSPSEENVEDLQDPYSDAMLQFQEEARRGKPRPPMRSTLFTYFYTLFLNRARKDYRRRGRFVWREDSRLFDEPAPGTESGLEEYVDRVLDRWQRLDRYRFGNSRELVEQLLASLEDYCRLLLNQHFLEEEKYEEMAAELDKTMGALRKNVHDCIKRLRKLLAI